MTGIPAIRMIKILRIYAIAKGLALKVTNLESIKEVFEKYNKDARLLN